MSTDKLLQNNFVYIIRDITLLLKKEERIFKECYDYTNIIDLSNKSITLVYVGDKNLKYAVKSYLNTIHKVKFTDYKFFTSNIDANELNILKNHGVNITYIKPIKSIISYDKFIASELYKHIDTNHVLIIQEDSSVLWQSSWTDEFLNYDYIGAPWSKSTIISLEGSIMPKGIHKYFPKYSVGNNGFCLISTKMLRLIDTVPNKEKLKAESGHFLDQFLCSNPDVVKYMEDNGIIYAPREIASKFSYEWDVEINNDWFGIHCTKYNWMYKFLDRMPTFICEQCIL